MAPGKLTEVWPCCRVKLWDAGHVIRGDESTGREMKDGRFWNSVSQGEGEFQIGVCYNSLCDI